MRCQAVLRLERDLTLGVRIGSKWAVGQVGVSRRPQPSLLPDMLPIYVQELWLGFMVQGSNVQPHD